ncbi:hypothetical protein HPHPP28B_0973 [Helicobacter pylori Hp P-28b]|nr:hypothetical protein HPHPP28B_0973 [Helicobacter pylori Hp P-28b]
MEIKRGRMVSNTHYTFKKMRFIIKSNLNDYFSLTKLLNF